MVFLKKLSTFFVDNSVEAMQIWSQNQDNYFDLVKTIKI